MGQAQRQAWGLATLGFAFTQLSPICTHVVELALQGHFGYDFPARYSIFASANRNIESDSFIVFYRDGSISVLKRLTDSLSWLVAFTV
jgi:hypothetical protein